MIKNQEDIFAKAEGSNGKLYMLRVQFWVFQTLEGQIQAEGMVFCNKSIVKAPSLPKFKGYTVLSNKGKETYWGESFPFGD